MKKVLSFVMVIGVALGMRFCNKALAHSSVKDDVLQLCDGDEKCEERVESRYEACFDKNYDISKRHLRFNEEKFMACILK